ncbi:FAD-dependent monooxygenase [Saccharophagus degradans]|uniref:FAD-dependent oxidoreductase n=1 Tax=Saccharophagus degradans TaxID=86304 RepID=UPI002477F61B|nr:FAD-dependent monooxygenase [Saccharophagus degradans]WGO98412.1 FAD-dependent monooxygenase [Saccharophagus degradans]
MTQQCETSQFDILIIGAGLSGTCLAHVLSRASIRSCVIDQKEVYPENFRADKLEYNQIAAFREFGLDQFIVPRAEPIGTIQSFEHGTVNDIDTIDQYGFAYTKSVNKLRENLPDNAKIVIGKVAKCTTGPDRQTITLKDGRCIAGRLLVIATGGGGSQLVGQLGLKRKTQDELTSLNFGFDVSLLDGSDFKFNGFNYHAEQQTSGVNYVTFFPIGNTMKVNIFTQWDASDSRTKAMRANPLEEMNLYFKELKKYTGELKLLSKVQVFPTAYYRIHDRNKDGVIVIADEFQSVSPATGKGLDKLTTDIRLLCNTYIPTWLKSKTITAKDIKKYYSDPQKEKCDLSAYSDWVYYRNLSRGYGFNLAEKITFRLKTILNKF